MHTAAQSRRPTPGHIVPDQLARAQVDARQSTEAVTQLAGHQTDLGNAQLNPALHTPPSQFVQADDSASSDEMSVAGRPLDNGDNSSDDLGHDLNKQEIASQLPPSLGSRLHSAAKRQLILSADINLDELDTFQEDLTALNVYLPPNTLVLELTDGLCLFPSLNLGSTSSDSAAVADRAAASLPVITGSAALQDQAIGHAVPDSGSVSEQVCAVQLLPQICIGAGPTATVTNKASAYFTMPSNSKQCALASDRIYIV